MSVLLAIGFTSTLMHYYFDGYIWKVRHVENRETLALGSQAGDDAPSWWSSRSATSRWPVFWRQIFLFGVPATVLTIGATSLWSTDRISYIDHMYNAFALDRDARPTAAASEASLAFDAMNRQLPVAKKLAELQPSASREAALAYLLFNRARYENLVMPTLNGGTPSTAQRTAQLAGVNEAIAAMERALHRPGPLHHEGRDQLTRAEAERTLASWRAAAQQLESAGYTS